MDAKAPFRYFGGKSKVASEVWLRFGDVPRYVEPFVGSMAVLLGRPSPPGDEIVNDKDGFLCNFWRSLAYGNADAIADFVTSFPRFENEYHAIESELVKRMDGLVEKLEGDITFCDPALAAMWLWGTGMSLTGSFCHGAGPWVVQNGRLVKTNDGKGVPRNIPCFAEHGRGIFQKFPPTGTVHGWMTMLANRIAKVRVACGDWSRVCTDVLLFHGDRTVGVFLDPPYLERASDAQVYVNDSTSVARDVRAWAMDHGDDKRLRIALCGYDTEHLMPRGWTGYRWKANGGFSKEGDGVENASREVVWFSPACLPGTHGNEIGQADVIRGVLARGKR